MKHQQPNNSFYPYSTDRKLKMKEIKISQSSLTMPADGNKPESQHVAKEIKLLQFPHGNQTLLQDNAGMNRDAVTLNPDQLLELIRESNYVLEPLRDAFVEEATGHIVRGNKILIDRLEQASNEELKTYLRSHIDRNQSNLLKAKGAFYTPQHNLYMALCSGIPAAITLLFADARMGDDENLLEALRALEKPVDLSAFKGQLDKSLSALNPHGSTCGGRRVDMMASELTPEQIRERNAADSQGGPDGH